MVPDPREGSRIGACSFTALVMAFFYMRLLMLIVILLDVDNYQGEESEVSHPFFSRL